MTAAGWLVVACGSVSGWAQEPTASQAPKQQVSQQPSLTVDRDPVESPDVDAPAKTAGAPWTQTYAIACARQRALFRFAAGRGLIVGWHNDDRAWDAATSSWPTTYFLAVGDTVTQLGTDQRAIHYAWERDGRSFLARTVALEILGFDAALERATPAPAAFA